ncbi:hypothetical protein A0H81_05110 [Grifola frondosa]|uniref:Uncharacterized protein n=1 Tax=Grifola frondosa TaxID=5627 RepID=A0A1C7MC32_GRIFR|nr:hypothetical protein A0H81_05110 [Grifola frondosa]
MQPAAAIVVLQQHNYSTSFLDVVVEIRTFPRFADRTHMQCSYIAACFLQSHKAVRLVPLRLCQGSVPQVDAPAMSDPLSSATAELVAISLESLVFGAFCVLYGISTWILMYRTDSRNRTTLNKMLFATSTLMFALCIAHLGLNIHRAIQGFVDQGGSPDGTTNFYLKVDDLTQIAKSVIFITQTLVGDSFLTYRLFIVWDRDWRVIVIPILLLIGTGISGYGGCYQFTTFTGLTLIFKSALKSWLATFTSISLCTNVLATILISAKIMWSNRKVRKYRTNIGPSCWDMIETLIQSAAIYSAALICLLATYAANSNAQDICLETMQPLIGVVFTLIIIRVGLGHSLTESHPHPIADSHQVHCGQHEYPLRPVAISVTVSRPLQTDRTSFEQYKNRSVTEDADIETGSNDLPQ